MPEFTGNVHSLNLTLPFPAPAAGATVFAIGRVFGDPATGTDGLDVWVDDSATTSYDPPDGDTLTLPVATLLACTHGWLRFVPAGQQVPGLTDRTNAPLQVAADALVLGAWPTLRDNLELMVTLGSVLVPDVAAGKGGRPAPEYFIYENVDTATLGPYIDALIAEARPEPPASDAERAAMAAAFLDGSLQILARAGRVIGQAKTGAPAGVTPPAGAGASWKRLTLRVVDRLGQLFDPGWWLRRVRELSQVVEIPVIVDKTLIPSRDAIGGHPLPELTPARQIVDWRDAGLRPRAGREFFLAGDGTDPSAATPTTTSAWGLWVGPDLAAGADPLAASTVIVGATAEHVALGTLPNAERSEFRLARHLLADDYLVLSEVDLAEWFPERPAATPPVEPLRRYTQGNQVTALPDARDTFWELHKAMRRTFRDEDYTDLGPDSDLPPEGAPLPEADRAGHKLWIAGWQLSPDQFMRDLPKEYVEIDFDENGVSPVPGSPSGTPGYDPRGHVMGVLLAAAAAGVDVRAMLWRQLQPEPDFHSSNSAAVHALDPATPGGPQAILDAVGRTVGAHHQKAVVVENADGRAALLGGIDMARGRWDSDEHRPNDPRAQGGRVATADHPYLGWHDVHCHVTGPAVDDVETNFRQRWNAHPQTQTGSHTQVPSRSTPLDPIPGASHFVQINRTFPAGVPNWTFVSQSLGERGALAARLNAARRARRHIHIEEQYLVMVNPEDYTALLASPNPLTFSPSDQDTMAAVLRAKVAGADPVRVSILIPKKLNESPDFANMVLYEMRRRFITFLTHGLTDEQKRDRLLVFHLRNASGVPTYVHAKTMMVDDLWASIGSSNLGYRSLTYDSEINCDVVDGAMRRGRRLHTTDLRVRLWAEHLQLAANERHLVLDPRAGFELLRRAAEADWPRPHHVQPYDPEYYGDDLDEPGAPPKYNPLNATHEVIRSHLVDPDGRNPDDPTLDYAALLLLLQSL
jgi:phosphatidylserine/phosphatidylglycerophosphate/cardiolipin synthase-like enzyme